MYQGNWEHFRIRQITVLQNFDEANFMPCPIQENLQLSWCKLLLLLDTSSFTLLLVCCLLLCGRAGSWVGTAVVFDLLMLKLSTSCHLKIWPVPTPDLVCLHRHMWKSPRYLVQMQLRHKWCFYHRLVCRFWSDTAFVLSCIWALTNNIVAVWFYKK